MFGKQYETFEIFGQSRGIPKNYVSRKEIDKLFERSINSGSPVILYGSSKQGKTSLRKKIIPESNRIVVQCSNLWDLRSLHGAILSQAGFKIEYSSTSAVTGTVNLSLKAELWRIISGEASGEASLQESIEKRKLELDLNDTNAIIQCLKSIKFNKIIILEDFHYLSNETQENFAIAFKSFLDNSKLNFVIIGVWLEQNKLELLNGDLSGRIIPINAEHWSKEELLEVIHKGEELLNVNFERDLKEKIIVNCVGSVFILQELCKELCNKAGITKKQRLRKTIPHSLDVFEITREIICRQNGRYLSFIDAMFGNSVESELQLNKWILYVILKIEPHKLLHGVSYYDIKEIVFSNHPNKNLIKINQLISALNNLYRIQVDHKIKPIIVDYEKTSRKLNILERGFISWLIFQNRENLLRRIKLNL